MSKNREIEAKVSLDKQTYEAIKSAYPVKEDFRQTNTYYDTDKQLLKAHRNALRIRTFADHAEETIKVPSQKQVQDKYHEVIEINDELSLTQARELLQNAALKLDGSVGDYLKKTYPDDWDKIAAFTWSKTHRTLLNGPEDCELTLDHTRYPDGYSDYELEVENPDPATIKRALAVLSEKFAFSAKNANNLSKIARASQHALKK